MYILRMPRIMLELQDLSPYQHLPFPVATVQQTVRFHLPP
jgi:hypothetical protein